MMYFVKTFLIVILFMCAGLLEGEHSLLSGVACGLVGGVLLGVFFKERSF